MTVSRWDPPVEEITRFHQLVVGDGLSVRAAGLDLGWSLATAYRIAHCDGLPLRNKTLSSQVVDEIVALFAQNVAPMDIVRRLGVNPSSVYRVGISIGARPRPAPEGRRAVATARRVEYLELRACGLDRRSAAAACGMGLRGALDVDKGVIKTRGRRVPFVPDGQAVYRYKRLMQVLAYVDGRVSVPVEVLPQAAVEKVIDRRYLSLVERERIADRVNRNLSVRAIARELGRDPGTISREISRNSGDDGIYRPYEAHRKSTLRRFRPKVSKIAANPRLKQQVWQWLRMEFSPEQVAGRLRREFPG